MTNRERFCIGGIGGLAPVLMFLATGDFERFLGGSFMTAIGYCVRSIILFFIGGFVVWLYEEEKLRIKVFQLGLGAPAMIASFLAVQSNITVPHNARPALGAWFVPSVFAQTNPSASAVKHFTLPAPNPTAQFLQGLIGIQPKNVWFVIAGSFMALDDAIKMANKLNSSFPNYHADVYAPYRDNPYYAVVIAANLTQAQAKIFRDKATVSGFPKQTYYKTFPDLPMP